MARLDDDFVTYGIPDRGSGLVGWDTTDGLDAALMDEYEWWGVTPDGRHCCTECVDVADDHDGYMSPDGLPLERLTHVVAVG